MKKKIAINELTINEIMLTETKTALEVVIPTAVFNDDVIAELNEAAFGLLNREETESTDKPASWSVLKAFTVAAGITLHAEFSTEPKLSAEMATKSVILIPALS